MTLVSNGTFPTPRRSCMVAEHVSTPESDPGGVAKQADAPDPTDEQRLLLEFVGDRDVPCPRCGYNLRALTKPVCPECREELRLTVGRARMRFGLFLAALIPGVHLIEQA